MGEPVAAIAPDIRRPARELASWLTGPAAALWLDRGLDRAQGGYYDQLSPLDASNACDFKRLRVCCRQIFVFSQFESWAIGGGRDAMAHGLAYLFDRLRHPEGGYVRSVALDGSPLDSRRDLYDLAFVIYALAAAYRCSPDPVLLEEARSVLGFIRDAMAHPHGGFVEAIPPALPRRQNPHMHLLEACLAWLPLTDSPDFTETAKALLALFVGRLWNESDQCLYEYFTDDWHPVATAQARIFEPGHHFEWIWLLDQCRRNGLIDAGTASGISHALAGTAMRHGIHPVTGLPYAEVRPDGQVVDSHCRIWVITEWLRVSATQPDVAAGDTGAVLSHLARFTQTPLAGLWYEKCDAVTGTFETAAVPASSLYHIVTGLAPIVVGVAA